MGFELRPGNDLTEEVRRLGGEQIGEALMHLSALPGRNKSVHEARKCLKRTRSLLRIVRPSLDRRTARKLDRRTADIARSFSGARDCPAMIEAMAVRIDRARMLSQCLGEDHDLYVLLGHVRAGAFRKQIMRYWRASCRGIRKKDKIGALDEKHVSTSYVERMNLSIRMDLRRFTRLTNAFSKKFENHCHALVLYFVWYNFCKQHKSLGGISPAMVADVSDTLRDMEWIVSLIDARALKPGPCGPYKKKVQAENSN